MRQKNSADLEATGNTTKQAFEVGERGGGVGWLREWPYRMQLLSCSESEPQRAKVGFWKVLLHLPLWERRKSKAQGVERTPSSSVALPVPVLPWQNSLPLGWPTCLRNCSVAIVTWNKIPLWKVFTKCLFCREWSPERQDYMYTMFSKNIYLTVSVAPSNIGICWHWKNNALVGVFPMYFHLLPLCLFLSLSPGFPILPFFSVFPSFYSSPHFRQLSIVAAMTCLILNHGEFRWETGNLFLPQLPLFLFPTPLQCHC